MKTKGEAVAEVAVAAEHDKVERDGPLLRGYIVRMSQQPTLATSRLILRPFTLQDTAMVQKLAGDWELARTTINIPHPYENGMAEQWIGTHATQWEQGRQPAFALTRKEDDALIGAMGLTIAAHQRGELGYWVGRPYWGHGYCTEAAPAVLEFAFGELKLHRVHASCFATNPASARVMQKIGMTYEGTHKQHVRNRSGQFEDRVMYGIVRGDFP